MSTENNNEVGTSKLEKVRIYSLSIDAHAAASAFCMGTDKFIKRMKDGRTAAPWAEDWAAAIEGLKLAEDTNQKYYDAVGDGDKTFSNKTLTRYGVKFLTSGKVGIGRTSTLDDLKDALSNVDAFQVVDIRNFPTVRIVTFKSEFLMAAVKENNLKKSGWDPKRFYEWLFETFDVVSSELVFDPQENKFTCASTVDDTSPSDFI